jgi:hypothetical protein
MIYISRANLLNLFIQLWRDTLRKDTIVTLNELYLVGATHCPPQLKLQMKLKKCVSLAALPQMYYK